MVNQAVNYFMSFYLSFLSSLNHLKTVAVSLAAIAATITPTPIASVITQSFVPNAPNIPNSSGTSRNWSGYAATGGQFTAVNGTWTVPAATGNGHTSADATWVGIGGISSSDLIQAGTQNTVDSTGNVTSSAFYELLPNVSQNIPVTVKAGDTITVAITQQSSNQWQISFTDKTTNQNYQLQTISYTSSLSSAEWIEEAPSNGITTLPLDNFGTITFSSGTTTRNGSPETIGTSSGQAITMVTTAGQVLASTSSLGSDQQSFTVTRSNVVSSNPVPQFDRNPRGFRRHGFGIGSYTPIPRPRWQYRWVTVTPTLTPGQSDPTPTPTQQEINPEPVFIHISPSSGTSSANEQQRRFLFRGRNFGSFLQRR